MLDVVLFRVDQGGNPDLVRESQRRRYVGTDDLDAQVGLVDKVIEIDSEWRKTRTQLNDLKQANNKTKQAIGGFMKKKEKPPDELFAEKKRQEEEITAAENKEKELIASRDATIGSIGNLVPDDVLVDHDEDNNPVVDTYGSFEREDWMASHFDLVQWAGMANTVAGTKVAGSRGYFLTGPGVLLNQALISYAIHFLTKRGSTMLQTPFVMNKSLMGRVAQLSDFDEQLYKVTGAGEDQYLIATSEQPICAYHSEEWLAASQLPKRYAGYSTCFRKEAGSHGRDQAGIFRVHQFEKVEQFTICSPEGRESWDLQEELIGNCKDFYKSLGIPYRVVNIVSGALNDAAAKKYDLEAWFPGSKAHRELVSCSNCTDYQARRLEIRYGQAGKDADGKKKYVHMLNSTLIATERAMCCVIENYQTKTGIKVPEVLQPYMGGCTFIPFLDVPKPKKGPAPPQHVPSAEELLEAEGGDKEGLQKYMDSIHPALQAALNTIAKERPADPIAALSALLAAPASEAPVAPPTEKKKDKDAPPTAETRLDIVGMTCTACADQLTASLSAVDGVISATVDFETKVAKVIGSPGFPTSAVLIEAVAAGGKFTASEKALAGGMHKFDPTEVDVNGGDATADDFMDAFGF